MIKSSIGTRRTSQTTCASLPPARSMARVPASNKADPKREIRKLPSRAPPIDARNRARCAVQHIPPDKALVSPLVRGSHGQKRTSRLRNSGATKKKKTLFLLLHRMPSPNRWMFSRATGPRGAPLTFPRTRGLGPHKMTRAKSTWTKKTILCSRVNKNRFPRTNPHRDHLCLPPTCPNNAQPTCPMRRAVSLSSGALMLRFWRNANRFGLVEVRMLAKVVVGLTQKVRIPLWVATTVLPHHFVVKLGAAGEGREGDSSIGLSTLHY